MFSLLLLFSLELSTLFKECKKFLNVEDYIDVLQFAFNIFTKNQLLMQHKAYFLS